MTNTRRSLWLLIALLPAALAWPAALVRAADEPAAAAAPVDPPDEAAQAAATKLINDLFGTQIESAKTPSAKDELAKKLLQQGIASTADPAGRFVLYRMARDFAVGVGDMSVALQSIDETARDAFRFDTIDVRQQTLASLAKTATNAYQSRLLADANWSALDDAIAADNFDAAKRLATQGLAAARRAKDADMLRQWMPRGKEIDEIDAAYEDVRPALAKLAQKPLDPQANWAAGRYRVFVKGNWDLGLPMIALGDASVMQALAIAELSPPEEPEAQLKLADGWWDLADKTQDPSEKERLQGRALYWYGQARPKLSGLLRVKVEKRLQEVTGRIFARVKGAVRSNKVQFTSPVVLNRRGAFIDGPAEGGLLIGFDIGLSEGGRSIRSIRPIFSTSGGETQGGVHGSSHGEMVTVRAHEGFAVGGLTVQATNRLEGLSITFMQIQGTGLNPRITYTSDWYGGRTTAIDIRLGGSGTPVIGIGGKVDGGSLLDLALMQTR